MNLSQPENPRMQSWSYLVLASGCALFSSCGSLGQNALLSQERPQQTVDALNGTRNLSGTVFRASVVSSARYPVTSLRTGVAMFLNRSREVVVSNVPASMQPEYVTEYPPGSDGFEMQLDREGLPMAEQGRVRCLIDGDEFFPELDRFMNGARQSLDMQVFIFDNDDIACRYADRMKLLSKDVKVRVLLDDLGSTWAAISPPETPAPEGFKPLPDVVSYLRSDSNVHVRRSLNPWLVADHTKLIVVDNKAAMLGGMNIGREYYSEWHDLMVRIDGPVVKTLSHEFDVAWKKSGKLGDLRMLLPRRSNPVSKLATGKGGVRLLRTDLVRGQTEIFKAHISAIRASRKRIWVQSPYFSSDEIMNALAAAAKRGVDVRVIIPTRNDSGIMHSNNLATAQTLIKAGVKVYQYPGMTHTKIMLCDDWVTLGSANLDTLSMRINRELNIAFREPRAVSEVENRVFRRDFAKSLRVKLEKRANITHSISESIADQL